MSDDSRTLAVALKEWAVVVAALERGDQIFLLRKGGLADRGDTFEAVHSEFLLYPTTEHQRPEWLAGPFRDGLEDFPVEPNADDHVIVFTSVARMVATLVIPSREALDALEGQHIWSPAHLDQRWSYKPERPLALWILRVFNLSPAPTTPYRPPYAGCRSWVPLGDPIPLPRLQPALDDGPFTRQKERIEAALRPFGC